MEALARSCKLVPRDDSTTRIRATIVAMILVAVPLVWSSTFRMPVGGEFIPIAGFARIEGGVAWPPIKPRERELSMGRQLSLTEAARSSTTVSPAEDRSAGPEALVPNQFVPHASNLFVRSSTFPASHMRVIGRVVMSLKPSQDSTRFFSDPRSRHAVAQGLALLAEAPLHAITTSLIPTASTLGSVSADFTATFEAEHLSQSDGQPTLVHFPKAALFAHKAQDNNTASSLGTFILAAIESETASIQPYALEVLTLSLLLFEEISVRDSPANPSAAPVAPQSSDDGLSSITWLSMALVATGATITFLLVLICFGVLLWRCCPCRRQTGTSFKASVTCIHAADATYSNGALSPQSNLSVAERKLAGPERRLAGSFATPVAPQHAPVHVGQAGGRAADKRQPRFKRRQQVLVFSGSQGGWVEGSVHSVLADGSIVVRYGKGKSCFEKKVPQSKVETSIRRPFLRKQKVKIFCEEIHAWVPGTIEVAHTDDSLVVLYEKGGSPCRIFVPKMLVQSRIRRVR